MKQTSFFSAAPVPTSNLTEMGAAIDLKFQELAKALSQFALIKLEVLHVEPTRPRNGMLVYADGTDWNPGSGQGIYAYVGGAWTAL